MAIFAICNFKMDTITLDTLTIIFDAEISIREIPLFRAAVSSSIGSGNPLFHNHLEGGTLRYSYPLIQYKRIDGKASIFSIGPATDVIWEFFQRTDFDIRLGRRYVRLSVKDIVRGEVSFSDAPTESSYHLDYWLALNEENYRKYLELDCLSDRVELLERLLVGNVLSMYKGCDVFIDRPVSIKIQDLSSPELISYKSIPLMAFDVKFRSNVPLPLFAGLGKHVSVGFGTCYAVK